MTNQLREGDVERTADPLVTWTKVIYALHAFSLVTGIVGTATIVGGFLARSGWPASRVELFARAVLAHVGGQNAPDHVRTARNAAEAYERGRNACGFPQLAETFGE